MMVQLDQYKLQSLIKLTMLESRISNRSSNSIQNLPQKEQWALIYQHRALQLERAKSMQKVISNQKRENFKKQLDNQLEHKHNKGAADKEEDRRYYEYIIQKSQQMKEKEQKQKFERYIATKQLQEHNRHIIQSHVDPRLADTGKVYNIQIGLKSQMQKKQRAQAIKKDVIQTLDKQKFQKLIQRQAERQKQALQKQRNEQYQSLMFQNRSKQTKKYEQNQNVYNYYRDLFQQKMRKDKELERKFVDEVQQRKIEEQNKKKEHDLIQKQRKNLDMKDTLSRQIELLNHRRQQDKSNPEQTYSFINNIFREKKPNFDKQEYSLYLQKQAQEQKFNRMQQKYMNEEEYRLNSNQLNKAINGSYTFDNYQDRSMVTLGDKINVNQVQPLNVPDAELVKNKLQDARSNRRNRSMGHSASELAAIF